MAKPAKEESRRQAAASSTMWRTCCAAQTFLVRALFSSFDEPRLPKQQPNIAKINGIIPKGFHLARRSTAPS